MSEDTPDDLALLHDALTFLREGNSTEAAMRIARVLGRTEMAQGIGAGFDDGEEDECEDAQSHPEYRPAESRLVGHIVLERGPCGNLISLPGPLLLFRTAERAQKYARTSDHHMPRGFFVGEVREHNPYVVPTA